MLEKQRLSARSSQWFTPPWLLDVERDVLGGEFDLDPASCGEAQRLVNAARWHDGGERGDGLRTPWSAERMHLNPPYSPKDGGPIDPWIALTEEEHMERRLIGGCLVLPATPKKFAPLWAHASIVFLDQRIRFVETIDQAWTRWAEDHPADVDAEGERVFERLTTAGRKAFLPEGLTIGPAPTGEHAIAYLGPDHARFQRLVWRLGTIIPAGSAVAEETT